MARVRRFRVRRESSRDRIADLLMATSGALTTQEIIGRLGLAKSLVSVQLRALEEEGWIERHPIPGYKLACAWTWRTTEAREAA